MRSVDWSLFWAATTAAATVATAISTSLVLVLRRRERPEPDWAVNSWAARPSPHSDEKRAYIDGRITNAGDGRAFRVTVTGSFCDVELFSERSDHGFRSSKPFEAVMHPGESAPFGGRFTEGDLDRAEIIIAWTRSPTRLQKRISDPIPLREIAELPDPE